MTVAGRIRPTDDHLVLVAGLVLVGPRGTFTRLVGLTESVVKSRPDDREPSAQRPPSGAPPPGFGDSASRTGD